MVFFYIFINYYDIIITISYNNIMKSTNLWYYLDNISTFSVATSFIMYNRNKYFETSIYYTNKMYKIIY